MDVSTGAAGRERNVFWILLGRDKWQRITPFAQAARSEGNYMMLGWQLWDTSHKALHVGTPCPGGRPRCRLENLESGDLRLRSPRWDEWRASSVIVTLFFFRLSPHVKQLKAELFRLVQGEGSSELPILFPVEAPEAPRRMQNTVASLQPSSEGQVVKRRGWDESNGPVCDGLGMELLTAGFPQWVLVELPQKQTSRQGCKCKRFGWKVE